MYDVYGDNVLQKLGAIEFDIVRMFREQL